MKKGYSLLLVAILLIAITFTLFLMLSRLEYKNKIVITTNPWVGFSPFAYAKEKGWLDSTGINIVWLSGLSENTQLYDRGFTQGFLTTQLELLNLNTKEGLVPILLIDRSNGADVIVSNRTLDELKNLNERVDVYLEHNSINLALFKAFLKEYDLEHTNFNTIESSQVDIAELKNPTKAILAISYSPYVENLYKKGLKKVASTKEIGSLHAIDALFVKESVYLQNKEKFKRLQEIYNLALEKLRSDPKEFYETTKLYLEGQSFEEFVASLELIKFLDNNSTKEIEHLKSYDINTHRLPR